MLKKLFITVFFTVICLPLFAQKNTIDSSLSSQHNGFAHQILNFAKNHLHHRYRSGGITPLGFDCSGFVYYCFKNFGVKLPHSSAAQGTLGDVISREAAIPGDLIFFKGHSAGGSNIGHVGLITEVTDTDIKFIHSAWNGGVRYDVASADYYRKRFMGIRRVIGSNTELDENIKTEAKALRRYYKTGKYGKKHRRFYKKRRRR